ncbi:hypothetical protein OF829_12030 [Sphingomonas sp. LB-2]|uniref:hypothetical protein n=1 Tax=Sphingomonas caeni TaxID=2984949 RepID=UPI002231645B|nr:hypothetical protein [Sphingomonas caeni]MCW3847968.1 hypothetical protein [Sphingomonas caeni]
MNSARRTLELSMARKRGIWAAAQDASRFSELYNLLWGLDILAPRAADLVKQALAGRGPAAACLLLIDPTAFRHRFVWRLFWALSQASLDISDPGLTATHEPELNGAFIGMIQRAIASFRTPRRSHDLAVVIGDHATLGNEARSGADFGLIIEIDIGDKLLYLVTLLQAKRATSRIVDVRRAAGDSTQRDRLLGSGIGSYLFYIAHDDPRHLGPTVKSAEAIGDPQRVDTIVGASDFAARMAAAAGQLAIGKSGPPYALPGFGAASSREDAAYLLFNPNIPDIRVNNVLVARIGDITREALSIAGFESDWNEVIARHREAVEQARGETGGMGTHEREPPLLSEY